MSRAEVQVDSRHRRAGDDPTAADAESKRASHGKATDPYLAVKGVRDIASGVAVFVLLASGKPRALGRFIAAASMIPIGDAMIVLRHNGPKKIAYGVRGVTAAAMLTTALLLLTGSA